MSDIQQILAEADKELSGLTNAEGIEAFRIRFLGKKGRIGELMARIPSLAPEERRQFGADVNKLKSELEAKLAEKKMGLSEAPRPQGPALDKTLPSIPPQAGHLHPLRQIIEEITGIFARMGFESVEGPEIETEFHNFTALNIPLQHASRDAFDTFYTTQGRLLRSQTSTVQIRIMQKRKPPLRMIAPGRVYRPDTVDASHSFMFHQIEGLMVDDKVTFSDLKGILHHTLRELFGKEVKVRFRPHFFPFTEPSVEVDLLWGKSRWLEILGAGMVHPKVFEAVGYAPAEVQGFAFGMGVERLAMLRYGIPDIRYFYENDTRFLRQF